LTVLADVTGQRDAEEAFQVVAGYRAEQVGGELSLLLPGKLTIAGKDERGAPVPGQFG
jgi:hypothetical protein